MSKFEMKDLGLPKQILGIRIEQKAGKVIIDQKRYIKELLDKYGMSECKPVATPLELGKKLIKPELSNAQKLDYERIPYQKLMGSLMFLAVCSRPDIAHALSFLSQFNNCYAREHWLCLKRVLRYLKGTIDYKLEYRQTGIPLKGFVDANWGGDENDRKSFTGFAFFLGGAVFSWESRKQKTVALSSTQAEYLGLSDAVREAIFLKNFLKEVFDFDGPVTIYNDSQSAQKIAKNSVLHNRTKHIDIRHHFIRDTIKKGEIILEFMETENMVADVFTKVLCKPKHEKFTLDLGLSVAKD